MSIHQDIAKLREERDAKAAEAKQLEALMAEFPDLQKKVGRWNKVAYYSKTVNTKVNYYDLRHNCGCCNDSPLELWPYLETPHGKVYSDPPCFQVGEKHWISGDRPYEGWKDKLREAGLPTTIIEAVSSHFRQCSDDRRALADEDYND